MHSTDLKQRWSEIAPKLRLVPLLVVAAFIASSCSVITSIGGTPAGAPSITSVSPQIGPQGGGGTVTIHGAGFIGASAVSFGIAGKAAYKVVSDTEITATAPSSPFASGIQISITNPSGSSPSTCTQILQGCSGGYFYSAATAWNFSSAVNVQNLAVPIPGISGASILVSATGGTVSVNGELDSSYNLTIPTAFIANGTASVSNLKLTFSGQISAPIEIPLPLGLPYGMDVYVTVDPAVSANIPVTMAINASWTFSGGFINGGISPMSSTLTCQGVNVSSSPSSFTKCVDASATLPSLKGAQASLTVSPLWLQVGPPGLDAAIGPKVGLSAGQDSTGANYWEICGALSWQIQATILNQGGNLLGPATLDSSTTGNPGSHCSLGAAS